MFRCLVCHYILLGPAKTKPILMIPAVGSSAYRAGTQKLLGTRAAPLITIDGLYKTSTIGGLLFLYQHYFKSCSKIDFTEKDKSLATVKLCC